jgi:DNA-binding helix-hairpin-helix protein with protein kinase domain
MSTPALYMNGKPMTLARRIGKGGEGEVYVLANNPDLAVKFYTIKDLKERQAKITAMIKNKLADNTKLVAFPKAIASKKDGSFAGFVMRLVTDHKPLFELYSPGARKQNFPKADYRFLVRAASNIAVAVAQIHKAGCVIGDINHSGILVSSAAVAAFIDADSFQISEGGLNHPCLVGVPEYTPPELQGQSLRKIVRTADHDAFGLAVVIFQLLFMGRHPFIGIHDGGDMALDKAIREHRFAYSLKREVGMVPPPGACTLRDVPKPLAELFERAFAPERTKKRPNAVQWAAALQKSESELIECASNQLHYHYRAASRCPWCHMEEELSVALFLPNLIQAMTFQTGRFNIEAFWKDVEAITIPKPEDFVPVVPNKTVKPSIRARLFKLRKKLLQPLLATMLVINSLTYLFDHALVFVSGAVSLFLIYIMMREKAATFIEIQMQSTAKWQEALKEWNNRVEFSKFKAAKDKLAATHQEFMKLKTDVEKRIKDAHSSKHNPQITDHLSQFNIGKAKLKGLGEAKVLVLASYGIDTAAGIIESKIRAIPGFGRANTQILLDWRKSLESNFHYVPRPNSVDMHAVRRIHSDVQVKSQSLQKELEAGRLELEQVAKSITAFRTTLDPKIVKPYFARKRAIEDLKYLGLTIP